MGTKSILLAALAGAVTWFLMAGVFLGGLFNAYIMGNMNEVLAGQTLMDKMGQQFILVQFVSIFAWSLLLALVIQWSGATGWKAGARKGVAVGFLLVTGLEVTLQVFTTFWRSLPPMLLEVALITSFATAAGAMIGWILGRDRRPS